MAGSGPVAFLKFCQAQITITDNCQVAVINGSSSNKLIVYLDRIIPSNKAFTFKVENEHKHNFEYSFELGVTTCTKKNILEGFYHMFSPCKGDYDCHSYSQKIRIGKPKVDTVKITKSRSADHLLDILVNGSARFHLDDRTGNNILGKDMIPFIIFSGSARRIRVWESSHIDENTRRERECAFPGYYSFNSTPD